ncbi:E4 protein [Eumops bonariensis papillomavirus type 1]|nr:E4 protein [Eumops bonariensis papillomavirus type 1]
MAQRSGRCRRSLKRDIWLSLLGYLKRVASQLLLCSMTTRKILLRLYLGTTCTSRGTMIPGLKRRVRLMMRDCFIVILRALRCTILVLKQRLKTSARQAL